MKIRITILMLIAFLLQLSVINRLQAQTSIVINYAYGYDSITNYCSAPIDLAFYVEGDEHGYQPGDVLKLKTNYGDGTIDSSNWTIPTIPLPNGDSSFWFSYHHIYNSVGSFSCQYIVTGPDGTSDTITRPNEIFIHDTCGAISGMVYLDMNSNCVNDAGDIALPNDYVRIMSGSTFIAAALTDNTGHFSVNVQTGNNFTVEASNNIYSFNTSCPTSGLYNITSLPAANLDFGLGCTLGFDLTGYLFGWYFKPGSNTTLSVGLSNMRCLSTSGQAKLILDPLLTYTGANPAPNIISGDTLIWIFSNLYYTSNNMLSFANIGVTTSSSAIVGDSIHLKYIIDPIQGDSVPSNNIIYSSYPIVNSWDPNGKQVSPSGETAAGYIAPATDLTYTISFQNTGNSAASNVIILDTLNNNLDPATVQIIGASHAMRVSLTGANILKFTFNNIMLPDSSANEAGSHGYIIFKIKQKPLLSGGITIKNKAFIYFDFNPAIVTNQTLNTILATGIHEMNFTPDSISIYPNPAADNLTIEVPQQATIEILNIQGQLVKTLLASSTKTIVDVSALPGGVYVVEVKTEKGIKVKKFIKE